MARGSEPREREVDERDRGTYYRNKELTSRPRRFVNGAHNDLPSPRKVKRRVEKYTRRNDKRQTGERRAELTEPKKEEGKRASEKQRVARLRYS